MWPPGPRLLLPRGKEGECRRSQVRVLKEGSKWYISWVRAKNGKSLKLPLPKDDAEPIRKFLEMRAKTNKHYNEVLARIGERAGYDNVSCGTMRRTFCIRALTPIGEGGLGLSFHEAAAIMGCTLEVLHRNYAQLRMDQVMFGDEFDNGADKGDRSEYVPTACRQGTTRSTRFRA